VNRLPVLLQGLDPFGASRQYYDESWDPVFEQAAEFGCIMSRFTPKMKIERPSVKTSVECIETTDEYEDRRTTHETPDGVLTSIRRNLFLTGATLEHSVKSISDIKAASWLNHDNRITVDKEATLTAYEQLLEKPNVVPTLAISEPVAFPYGLLGAERFAFFLVDHPQALLDLIEAQFNNTIRCLKSILETGIKPVVFVDGSEFVTPPFAGASTFRTLVFPYLQQMSAVAHSFGCMVLSHCHGNIATVLDMFLESGIDGTHPFEAPPSGDITAVTLKKRVGRSLSCVGNIQLDDMLRAPRGVIEKQVEDLLAVFNDWHGGGFVLSVSGTPTCKKAPSQAIENYLYLLSLVRDF